MSTGIPLNSQRIIALAERDPRRGVSIAKKALKRTSQHHSVDYAWGVYTLSKTLLLWERMQEAIHTSQEALHVFTRLQDRNSWATLYCEQVILIAKLLQGNWQNLDTTHWQELTDRWVQARHPLEAARTSMYHAFHLYLSVHSKEAHTILEKIQPIIMQEGTTNNWAFLLGIQAGIEADMGNLNQALEDINQAKEMFTQNKNARQVAICQFKRSWILQQRKQFDQAQADLEQALKTFHRLDLPLHIALCERNLGLALYNLGYYGDAMQRIQKAQVYFRSIERLDTLADCDLSLGNIAYCTRSYEIALAHYRHAEHTYMRMNNKLWMVSQRNQAMVLCDMGRPAEALDILSSLEEPYRQISEPQEIASFLHTKAQILAVLEIYSSAMDVLQEVQQRYARLNLSEAVAVSIMDQGWVAINQQEYRRAAACFQSVYNDLRNSTVAWRVDYGLGHCLHKQGDTTMAMNYYIRASSQVAELRQGFASQGYSSSLFAEAQNLYQDALMLAFEHGDAETVVALIEEQRALVLQRQIASSGIHFTPEKATIYKQQYEQLRSLIEHHGSHQDLDTALFSYLNTMLNARHSNPLPETLLIKPTALPELRRQLDTAFDDWIILLYAQSQNDLLIVAIDTETIELHQTPFDQQLQDLLDKACLDRWRAYVFSNPDLAYLQNKKRRKWAPLIELGERLLPASVRGRLNPDTRLLIVPSGQLHSIPWAALRIEDSWLCQRSVIQLLPSLSIWSHLISQPVNNNKEALLLGCSQFGTRAVSLPYVTEELDMVERCWSGLGRITRHEDSLVTHQALHNLATSGALQRYHLLHVGTHAQLLPNKSMQAHVKLWDDDMLLDEVVELRLGGALVVLATCDGAAGAVSPGEEVRSLSYAFLAAGARDVIASMWTFYGALVQGILKDLYHGLIQQWDAPTALTHALRELLSKNDTTRPECSPLVWGGLIAQGAGTVSDRSAGGTLPALDHDS